MKMDLKSLVALAVLLLTIVTLVEWLPSGAASASGSHEPEKVSAELPVGAACTVQIVRAGHQHSLSGIIRKVTVDWLILESHHESRIETATLIPGTDRVFTKRTVSRMENRELWIPTEAVLYVSISQQAGEVSSKSQEPDLEAPIQGELKSKTRIDIGIVPASAEQKPLRIVETAEGFRFFEGSEERGRSGATNSTIDNSTILPPGTHCRVQLRSKKTGLWSNSACAYEGKLLRVTPKIVLLSATMKEGRSRSWIPILADFPLIRPFVQSTGVGQENLAGEEIEIPLNQIASIEPVPAP